MAVGGSSERRGVIATCNYRAREYGVHSAMASATATKLCPQLVIVRPNMDKYRQASAVMREIFERYTELIEPLSLDEAYLDVSNADACDGSATKIAEEIRASVYAELGITVSAGVSNSKFLAKIASDWNKPDGLCVIPPQQVDEFVLSLPVKKIHGVGKVTAAKLHQMGIHTCADLRQLSQATLDQSFGRFGQRLYQLARGIDQREVSVSRIRKSVSVENTFPQDLPNLASCLSQLPSLLESLTQRLAKLPESANIDKAFVKIKFADFTSTTLERIGTEPSLETYQTLMSDAIARKTLPVRLLGLGVRLKQRQNSQEDQLQLFE